MADKILSIENVSKYYEYDKQRHEVLQSFTYDFERGKLYALVGPSGAGKTTLLKMLGGILKPTTGAVMVNGQDLYSESVKVRGLIRRETFGYIFQDYALIEDETAYYNIRIPFDYLKVSRREQRDRIDNLAKEFRVSGALRKKVSKLSGGERQRVGIVRGLAVDAPVILADEPTGALDKENRDILMNVLKKESHENGKLCIVVTHDTEVAMQCDHIINIRDGICTESDKEVAI